MGTDDETGKMHIHFELKERDKEFVPVTVNGIAALVAPAGPANFNSMFPTPSEHLNSVPETACFLLPSGEARRMVKDDDDDDSSAIQPQEQNQGFKTTGEEEEEDDVMMSRLGILNCQKTTWMWTKRIQLFKD